MLLFKTNKLNKSFSFFSDGEFQFKITDSVISGMYNLMYHIGIKIIAMSNHKHTFTENTSYNNVQHSSSPCPRAKQSPVDNKILFFRTKQNVFLLVRNIQKSKEICSQFLVTLEGLLGDQAQIKDDLTVLPENIVLESFKFNYVPIRVK